MRHLLLFAGGKIPGKRNFACSRLQNASDGVKQELRTTHCSNQSNDMLSHSISRKNLPIIMRLPHQLISLSLVILSHTIIDVCGLYIPPGSRTEVFARGYRFPPPLSLVSSLRGGGPKKREDPADVQYPPGSLPQWAEDIVEYRAKIPLEKRISHLREAIESDTSGDGEEKSSSSWDSQVLKWKGEEKGWENEGKGLDYEPGDSELSKGIPVIFECSILYSCGLVLEEWLLRRFVYTCSELDSQVTC